jgi:hypothetical protein
MGINFRCQRVVVHVIKYNMIQYAMEYLNSVNSFFFFFIRARSICPRCTAAYKAYCATLIPAPRDLDVPTSATRCLHVHMTQEIPAAKGGTCG